MSSTVEKISSNQVKISFDVEAEAFEQAIQKAYLKERGKINVPGFRKGKTPRKVIETMYGKGVFYEQALDLLFPDLFEAAIKEHDLMIVDRPSLDIQQMESGKPLQFAAEVYVMPDVVLGEYKNLDIARGSDTVDEDAVNQELERVRQRGAREIDVEDRPAQDDDIVTLDYLGTLDGVAFEGGSAEGYELTLGSGSFIPGFEEQVVGMSAGEEKDLAVTFPEGYHNQDLAGKDVIFHVKLHRIARRELPELDDDFAKDISEFDTLEEYRASILAKLSKDLTARVDDEWETALLDAAAANAQMDIPRAMIEAQIDRYVREFSMRLAYQGLQFDDFMRYTGRSMESLRAEYADDAEKRVRMELTLGAIVKAEGIVCQPEELEEEIAKMAKEREQDSDAYRKNLSENQLERIREVLASRKAIAILKASSAAE